MSTWFINTNYPLEIQNAFANMDKVLALKGEEISLSSISRVIKCTVHDKVFYIKHYFSNGKKLKKYFGRTRWQTEWKNILFCKNLQINVPNLIAYGEIKPWYSFKASQGVIVTEEISNATNLRTIVTRQSITMQNTPLRRKVISIVADYLRTMHDAKFINYDLQWRNILLTANIDTPKVYLFDMPSGGIRRFSFKRGVIRDFFNLYKNAHWSLSRTDQLRFYLQYRNATSLSRDDKVHIKQILTYFWTKKISNIRP